jgi:PleD family two-component response regulator
MASSDKPIVLIVDDTADNIDILKNVLHGSILFRIASNGEKAILRSSFII